MNWNAEIRKHALGGAELSLFTVIFTLILELISYETIKQVWKQPKGKELYVSAVVSNLINHFVLGVPVYVVAALFFCSKDDNDDDDLLTMSKVIKLTIQVLYLLVAHSFQYYAVHKAFHDSPTLYRLFHRFHHRFNTYVPPVAANAVTIGEYLIAYVIPFALAAWVGKTSLLALRLAIGITTVCNILVHTPMLESWSQRWIPYFWVSTYDHLNHHRKLQVHYASPTFNVDNILFYGFRRENEISAKEEDHEELNGSHR